MQKEIKMQETKILNALKFSLKCFLKCCVLLCFYPLLFIVNGCKDYNKFSHQSWQLATNLNLETVMLLDYGYLLIIKMVHFHVLVYMKFVNRDIIFPMPSRLTIFYICSSNYSQISGRMSDLDKTIISASK